MGNEVQAADEKAQVVQLSLVNLRSVVALNGALVPMKYDDDGSAFENHCTGIFKFHRMSDLGLSKDLQQMSSKVSELLNASYQSLQATQTRYCTGAPRAMLRLSLWMTIPWMVAVPYYRGKQHSISSREDGLIQT
jgi:hypothetical protein